MMQLISEQNTTALTMGNQRAVAVRSKNAMKNLTTCSQLSSPQGVNIAEIIPLPRLTPEHLAVMIKKMTVNYGDMFLNEKSDEFQRILDIFERCQKLGWSRNEFFERLEEFIDERRLPNFTRADFMAKERRKLYNYAWYIQEVAKFPSARFEAYYVGDTIMYRHWTGQKIPGLKFVEAFEQEKSKITDISRMLEESETDKEANKKLIAQALENFYKKIAINEVVSEIEIKSGEVNRQIEIPTETGEGMTVFEQLEYVKNKYKHVEPPKPKFDDDTDDLLRFFTAGIPLPRIDSEIIEEEE